VLQVLMITSLFACVLSFHNTVNRYFFVVSREGLLHRSLSNTHQEHQSPHVAGLIQLVLMAAILLALGFSAPDPVAIVGWASGFTAIGILIIQIMVSLSVIAFFRADRRETGLWRAMLAPAISAGLLSACLYLMVVNIQFVSGSDSPVVRSFPIIIAVLILSGVLFANWLRTARSATYENLGKILN
jgi:amino acid transporter